MLNTRIYDQEPSVTPYFSWQGVFINRKFYYDPDFSSKLLTFNRSIYPVYLRDRRGLVGLCDTWKPNSENVCSANAYLNPFNTSNRDKLPLRWRELLEDGNNLDAGFYAVYRSRLSHRSLCELIVNNDHLAYSHQKDRNMPELPYRTRWYLTTPVRYGFWDNVNKGSLENSYQGDLSDTQVFYRLEELRNAILVEGKVYDLYEEVFIPEEVLQSSPSIYLPRFDLLVASGRIHRSIVTVPQHPYSAFGQYEALKEADPNEIAKDAKVTLYSSDDEVKRVFVKEFNSVYAVEARDPALAEDDHCVKIARTVWDPQRKVNELVLVKISLDDEEALAKEGIYLTYNEAKRLDVKDRLSVQRDEAVIDELQSKKDERQLSFELSLQKLTEQAAKLEHEQLKLQNETIKLGQEREKYLTDLKRQQEEIERKAREREEDAKQRKKENRVKNTLATVSAVVAVISTIPTVIKGVKAIGETLAKKAAKQAAEKTAGFMGRGLLKSLGRLLA